MTPSDANSDSSSGPSPAPGAWPRLIEDYPEALIRLASLRADQKQHLVFAWVELYPFDMAAPADWRAGSKPWPVPGTKDWTCGFAATKVKIADAIDWYHNAASGRLNIAPANDKPVLALSVKFGTEPSIGRFAIGVEAPFLFRWHDGPRVHRLVPLQSPPRVVRELGRIPEARSWMLANLGFDPFAFDEWLGSVAMVAPDPLCCSVELFPGRRGDDGGETLEIRVAPRRNENRIADLSTATLVIGERRSGAWTSIMPVTLRPLHRTVAFPQTLGEVGHSLVCSERGLLRLVEPHSWLRQVNLHFLMGAGRARIEVPSGGRRKEARTYEVSLRNDATKSVVGESVRDAASTGLDFLVRRRLDRDKRGRAAQHVFGRHGLTASSQAAIKTARESAHEFVVDLVRKATRRLVFVDPYFGPRELRDLALRNENPAVTPRVLTSQLGLRANTGDVPGFQVQAGIVLASDLQGLRAHYGQRTPAVRVMPGGDTPGIHDRFLIVDDAVWHCGPSFNEIGERVGVIVRLPNPLEIRRLVSRMWVRSRPIEELASQAKSGRGPA